MEPMNPLFPLFRSRLMASVAASIFASDAGTTVSEIARGLGADRKNVSVVVDALEAGGVVSSRRVGRSRLLTANTEAPFHASLRELLMIVMGPPTVVARALEDLDAVRAAFIFGSWAARAEGEPGAPPRDVDVLVLSEERLRRADRQGVIAALEAAEEVIHRPVNPVFATIDQWKTSRDPFLDDVRRGPMVTALPLVEPDG